MTAVEYNTYNEYAKDRIKQGFQVLPKLLWTAIKTNNPNLVARKPFNPART